MLCMWVMLVPSLFGPHGVDCASDPEPIQQIYNSTDCEFPVTCSGEGSILGQCCYNCTGCPDMYCRNHWQCCHNKGTGPNWSTVDKFVKCTRFFMTDNAKNITLGPEPISYDMVAACPDDSPQRLKDLCSSSTEAPLIDRIPWMDPDYQDNGIIYRNKHCLQCHHSYSRPNATIYFHPNATILNLAFTRRPRNYYDPFQSLQIESKSNFFSFDISHIKTEDALFVSATFEETEAHRRELPSPCGFSFDLSRSSCQSAGDPGLVEACNQFLTPIKVKNTATNQLYLAPNLACAHCVLGDEMSIPTEGSEGQKLCRLEIQAKPWLLMNPLLLVDVENNTDDGIRNIKQINIDQGGKSCPKGYFFDKVGQACRQVLCPRHHFIYQGKCHPIFTYSVGQSYYIKVKVPVHPETWSDDTYNRLGLAVYDVIFKRSSFIRCSLKGNVKYIAQVNYVSYVVFEIFFSPPDGTLYQDVLNVIQPLFSSNVPFSFSLDQRKYTIYPADHVFFNQFGRLMDHNHDEISVLISKENTVWPFNKARYCHMPIPLTVLDFCNRVYLKQIGVIQQFGTLYDDHWERIDNDTVALCIKNYDSDVLFDDDVDDDGYVYVEADDPYTEMKSIVIAANAGSALIIIAGIGVIFWVTVRMPEDSDNMPATD